MAKNAIYIEKLNNYLLKYVVEDTNLVDFKFTNINDNKIGNIYRGKIVDKIASLNALFIDIGEEKNSFLQINREDFSKYKEGDSIIVQIIYPAYDDKGSKVSKEYEISNDYMVLFKDKNIQKISRKIKSNKKNELLELFRKSIKDYGFLIRTEAEYLDIEKLKIIISDTLNQMEYIDNQINFLPSPKLIYEKPNSIYNNLDDGNIITNDIKTYKYLKKRRLSNLIYDETFSYKFNHTLTNEVKKLGQTKIELENGAFITIEKTEAFHVIDVNSAGYTNKNQVGVTKEDANYKLAESIINQIYFRNLCGIILIDFISFNSKKEEDDFLTYFKRLASQHENPLVVLGFTRLGILEARRKRVGDILDYNRVFERET